MNSSAEPRELTEADFESAVLRSAVPVLVVFNALWSKPCAILMEVLRDVAIQCGGRARLFRVNVDEYPDLGLWYGIESVPTCIWFVEGKIHSRIVGTATAAAILSRLQRQPGS